MNNLRSETEKFDLVMSVLPFTPMSQLQLSHNSGRIILITVLSTVVWLPLFSTKYSYRFYERISTVHRVQYCVNCLVMLFKYCMSSIIDG